MPKAQEIVRRILKSRGLSGAAAECFFSPQLERDLHNPMLLPDIKPALKRLLQAQQRQEPVVVYGDYDIDGLCATTLLLRAFKEFGINATAFIPDRFEQGYGLNQEALVELIKDGAKLVVTVDCGTTATAQIKWAAQQGLDIIVTDHHEPGSELPQEAVAVVNPKRADSKYPFRELAGAGVAFKLVQAMQTVSGGIKAGSERWLLDLVAFATVCDVVPLLDENRTLAHFGLQLWPKTRWPGLKALMLTAGIRGDDVNATTLGYVFGPRLNAAGRIEHAQLALNLLTADKLQPALDYAAQLEELNRRRRAEQTKIEQAVLLALASGNDEPVIILADADWSHGVVGIVASRIMERTSKPTFLLQLLADGTAKGSARSFGGFDIAKALGHTSQLLISGGGHAAAGGLTLKAARIELFKQKILAYHGSLKLVGQSGLLKPRPDLKLSDLADVDLELVDEIGRLEPFGQGNPRPLFQIQPLSVLSVRSMGQTAQHCRLVLRDSRSATIEAVMFNADKKPKIGQRLVVMATVQANDFGGRRRAELVLKSWQLISKVATPPLM